VADSVSKSFAARKEGRKKGKGGGQRERERESLSTKEGVLGGGKRRNESSSGATKFPRAEQGTKDEEKESSNRTFSSLSAGKKEKERKEEESLKVIRSGRKSSIIITEPFLGGEKGGRGRGESEIRPQKS